MQQADAIEVALKISSESVDLVRSERRLAQSVWRLLIFSVLYSTSDAIREWSINMQFDEGRSKAT
jgi:hypothetical protein